MTRAELIQFINANIYPNGRNQITAPMVRDSILAVVGFLGDAAVKDIGAVLENNTDLVTGGAVYDAIRAYLSSVMKMVGETTTDVITNPTANPVYVDGEPHTAQKGDVVVYGYKEFWWTGSIWKELGDEASWALKTISITGTGDLTGGGTLEANRTLDLTQSAKDKLAHGETAFSWLESYSTNRLRLKSPYSYLNARKGLILEEETDYANTYGEGDTEPDLYVKTVEGTRVLYSPLPLITKGDQIVINGTPGGGGGGGVDHLYLLEDVYGNFTTGRVKTAAGADVSDGQALVWNTSLGKWVAGTVGGGSTYSAGTAIKIANDTISVSGTLDTDPISFDPDTHSGVDPSNPVAWGSASGPYGIKLSVNSVVKDLVLVSGYNALAARVTALENAPEGGITRIGTYQGAVTLGANLSITENGVLSATDTTYGAATTSAAGLMSAADKVKLNGIAEGATAVSDATVSGWGYAKTSALPGYASSDTAGIIKIGTGLTINDAGVVSVTGQTQGTVTRVDVGSAQYGPSASGVVSLPAYPTTLPASDVYSWAKAASKPSYAFSEITGTASASQIPTLAISKISGLQNALDGKQPLDADLTAIAGLTGTSGFLVKTAANEWALDTSTYLTAHQTIYQLVINNYAGTAQITYQPATSGNYSLTLTKAMVGLSNVPNWVFMITDSSTQTFVA